MLSPLHTYTHWRKTAKREILEMRVPSVYYILWSVIEWRLLTSSLGLLVGRVLIAARNTSETWSVNRGSLWESCSIMAFHVCCSEDTTRDDWRKREHPSFARFFFSLAFSRIMHCVVYTRRITWKGEWSVRNLSHENKKKKKKHREQQRKRSQLTRGPLRGWEGESEMNIIIIIIIITIDDGHCSSQGRRTK